MKVKKALMIKNERKRIIEANKDKILAMETKRKTKVHCQGYGSSNVILESYERLQKELHLSNIEMRKRFPDLCREMEKEQANNEATKIRKNMNTYFFIIDKFRGVD